MARDLRQRSEERVSVCAVEEPRFLVRSLMEKEMNGWRTAV